MLSPTSPESRHTPARRHRGHPHARHRLHTSQVPSSASPHLDSSVGFAHNRGFWLNSLTGFPACADRCLWMRCRVATFISALGGLFCLRIDSKEGTLGDVVTAKTKSSHINYFRPLGLVSLYCARVRFARKFHSNSLPRPDIGRWDSVDSRCGQKGWFIPRTKGPRNGSGQSVSGPRDIEHQTPHNVEGRIAAILQNGNARRSFDPWTRL